MLKRHEVEILLKAGHRKAEVARLAGVSLCSVKRIAQEGPVVHVDDAAERAQRQVGRPSRVANFRKVIVEILQQQPDLASLEILRRVREAAIRAARLHSTRWLPRFARSRPSPWFVSKACRGSSVSTILEKSKWNSSRAPAGASIFSPPV